MRIMAKTFDAWMGAHFWPEELRGMAEHGADTGWPGLTYYTDTAHLYERFKGEIWEHICQEAEDQGYANPFAFMAEWGGAKNVGSDYQMENLVVWYAAERYAREHAKE